MKILYRTFLALAFACASPIKAQTQQRHDLKHLAAVFANDRQVNYSFRIGNQDLPITWYERRTSLSRTNAIRTFVGYHDNTLIGTLAVGSQLVTGQITWGGEEYLIETQNDMLLLTKEADKGNCGTCTGEDCHATTPTAAARTVKARRPMSNAGNVAAQLQIDDVPTLYSDGVLRVYRLALLIDYSVFRDYFGSSIERAKLFWATAEAAINELYVRDLGMQFQVIDNDNLIRQTPEQELYNYMRANAITDANTANINALIGEPNYEVGVAITNSSSSLNGQAGMYSGYSRSSKAQAFAKPYAMTIAHEMGHLFGADHTFSTGGSNTMNTEPGRGTSIMSYGLDGPRDFFSLLSAYYVRKGVLDNNDYYTDTERTATTGSGNTEVFPYGIPTNNRPPAIDRSRIKDSYTIPQYTNFQFDIAASDPDNDPLYYAAHQADIRRYETSHARFRALKPSKNSLIAFQPTFDKYGYGLSDMTPDATLTGEYTFWLSAYDGKTPEEMGELPHAGRYDIVRTKVNIVPGQPFRLASNLKSRYAAGEKITLQWTVDPNVFAPDSKVRILLSDDWGRTFKHVLAAETDNDGRHDVVIPHLTFDSKLKYHEYGTEAPVYDNQCGVIKIEVIGHIAQATSLAQLRGGGFGISEPTHIRFLQTPEPLLTVARATDIPPRATVTAESKSGLPVSVVCTEEQGTDYCTRTYTATDANGNQAHFVQNIVVRPTAPPLAFTSPLPQDERLSCISMITPPPTLTFSGGTSPTITFTQTKGKGDYDNFSLYRTWTVTDPVAAPISHTQLIVIHDTVMPRFSAYPPHLIVKSRFDIPQQATLTATDNCAGQIPVEVYQMGTSNSYEYRWRATDASGNTASYTQYILIDDGTTIKANIAQLKAAEQGSIQASRLPNTIVTFNDGKTAYVEDATHGLRIKGLPLTFKAGDKLSADFQIMGIMEPDADGRLSLKYAAHTGSVASSGHALPLQQPSIATLLAQPATYADRRTCLEGISATAMPFVTGKSGKKELLLAEADSPTPRSVRTVAHMFRPVCASAAHLSLIGYPTATATLFDIVQQDDIWGSISLSDYRYATYYIDAPFTMPTAQTPTGKANGNTAVRGGLITTTAEEQRVGVNYLYTTGTDVPAHTALLINGDAGRYYYRFCSSAPAPALHTNLLRGQLDEQRRTTAPDERDYRYYLLTPNPDDPQSMQVGFYWRNAGGQAFVMPAESRTVAYLTIPQEATAQPAALFLDDITSGTLTSLHSGSASVPQQWRIHTLSGLRVSLPPHKLPKGIYIINGQKTIIK